MTTTTTRPNELDLVQTYMWKLPDNCRYHLDQWSASEKPLSLSDSEMELLRTLAPKFVRSIQCRSISFFGLEGIYLYLTSKNELVTSNLDIQKDSEKILDTD